MRSKLFDHLRNQWMGALALFLVLTGGVAYAANTVSSSDIIDNQVFSADVRNDTLTGGGLAAADLRSGAVGTAEIGDNQVRSGDVRDDSLSGGGLGASDLGTGSVGSLEVTDNSLGTSDVAEGNLFFENTLNANDLGTSSVHSEEVLDSSLNDEDISQGTFVDFTGNIGNVAAHDCVERSVTGVNAQGDHLLLSPGFPGASSKLIYSAEYNDQQAAESMIIQVCNSTGGAINDGTTDFNLLVIDAQ
jgi:hypothetical protein